MLRSFGKLVVGLLSVFGSVIVHWLDSAQRLEYLRLHAPALYNWLISPGVLPAVGIAGLIVAVIGARELWKLRRNKQALAHVADQSPMVRQETHGAGSHAFAVGTGRMDVTLQEQGQNTLKGCPQVMLNWEEGGLGKHLYVTNIDQTADAFNVGLQEIDAPKYALRSDNIQRIPPGSSIILREIAVDKVDGRELRLNRFGSGKLFFDALCGDSGRSVEIPLSYTDSVGRKYRSLSQVRWSKALERMLDVRLIGIVRLPE